MATKRKAGEVLRPYIHADEMQESLGINVTLTLQSAVRTDTFNSAATYLIDKSEMAGVGITINFEDRDAIRNACSKMVNELEDASIVILAEDGVATALRTSDIVWQGKVTELPEHQELFRLGDYETERGLVFGHASGAKHLHVVAIRNSPIDTLSPLKPRLKGAILGRVTFNMRPNPSFDSVVPQKLTDEVRVRLNLPSDSWYAFETKGGFLTANEFEAAFDLFVDEEMLEKAMSGAPLFKNSVDLLLTNLFMSSIIEEAISRFQDASSQEEELPENSAVSLWLRELLGEDYVDLLLGDKTRAISTALSAKKMKDRILKFERECDEY